VTPAAARGRAWWLLAALAGALLALGGRLELIREFGTSLPFRDEWKSTAADLLGPWADGRLEWRAFLAPLNDHWIVLTRLLSFGLARLNGQWNNLLETTVNAVLYGAAIWLFIAAAAPALGRRLGAGFALAAGFVLALPFTWENTLWGIQSLVFLQIGLSLVYLRAVALEPRPTAGWWLGQLAGGLVLFTQQSGVLAYAAAALVLGWRLARRDGDRRVAAAGLGLAALWTLVFLAFGPRLAVTAGHSADSWRVALDVTLRQLGWPLPHPAWAFLMVLPFALFAGTRLVRPRWEGREAFLLATGLWVAAQAAAIGYGRGGDTTGFVSRYCDFLALGYLVNAACLALLWRTFPSRAGRAGTALIAAAWIGCSLPGLWHESTASHTLYNLERRPAVNAQNLAAVRAFIATGNPASLAQEKIGDTLYTYPPTLVELLGKPRFRALLPPETGAAEARADYGRLGALARWLPRAGRGLAVAGALLGLGLALAGGARPAPGEEPGTTARAAPPVAAPPPPLFLVWCGATALAAAAWLAWPQPFEFATGPRWQAAYAPAGDELEFIDPVFHGETDRHILPEDVVGAVATEPAAVRPFWYGTLLGGRPGFTGILRSDPVAVRRRYLFTPVSGWPNWPGNAIRWRFENPADGAVEWRAAEVPPTEPREAVILWTVDAAAFRGWKAALVLFDGNGEEHAWLGVARPVATDDPGFGRRWLAALRAERAEPTHRVLAAAALLGLAGGAAQFVARRRRPRAGAGGGRRG